MKATDFTIHVTYAHGPTGGGSFWTSLWQPFEPATYRRHTVTATSFDELDEWCEVYARQAYPELRAWHHESEPSLSEAAVDGVSISVSMANKGRKPRGFDAQYGRPRIIGAQALGVAA